MKNKGLGWIFLIFFITDAHAVINPLRVAVSHYAPPYAMQSAHNQLYGFEIAMMDYICATIARQCKYLPMGFSELVPAVESHDADIAVSTITINLQRLEHVNFSIPYLPSIARFISIKKFSDQPFGLDLLRNKKIGVLEGSIFPAQIVEMGIKNPTIVTFKHEEEMIDALNDEKIDFVLMDAATALYWQSHGSGRLTVLGQPIPNGFLGIAVSKSEPILLQEVNLALALFKQSKEYKKAYQTYFEEF